jgi:hypothetical protein
MPGPGKPQSEKLYVRALRRAMGLGKEFTLPGSTLFDPAIPEDLQDRRALSPFVPEAASYNQQMLGKAREAAEWGTPEEVKHWRKKRAIGRPLNFLEKIWGKAARQNAGAPAGSTSVPTKRKIWGDRIKGSKGELYRQLLEDPKRPVFDMTGEKVSPTTFDVRSGEYDPKF